MTLRRPVGYLEASDFDEAGNLINPTLMNKPVLIMVQAEFCGYCTKAKPGFQQQFAATGATAGYFDFQPTKNRGPCGNGWGLF